MMVHEADGVAVVQIGESVLNLHAMLRDPALSPTRWHAGPAAAPPIDRAARSLADNPRFFSSPAARAARVKAA